MEQASIEDKNVAIPQINPDKGTVELSKGKLNFLTKYFKRKPKSQDGQPPTPKAPKTRRRKIIERSLLGTFVFLIVFFLALGIPSYLVYRDAQVLVASARNLQKAAQEEQDIVRIKEEISNVRRDLESLRGTYKLLGWTRPIPLLGAYYADGKAAMNAGAYAMDVAEVVVITIEPYADIIGFTAETADKAQSGEESANDRIEFIVESIESIIPQLDIISEKVGAVQAEMGKINPNRYPVFFAGREVRSKITKGLALIDEAASAIANSRPLLEAAPYFLGIDEERTYLLLFQNDKELRPTGGFITAYSILNVKSGKTTPVSSNDIYNLDLRYTPSIPAPDPIVRYIRGPYILSKNLRLRDMNFSPDFKESMDLFSTEVAKIGVLKGIDGIIAVDTQVVVNILEVLGPIGVPGFGNFSTEVDARCNCPQVIYELESFADNEGPVIWDPLTGEILQAPRGYGNRKEILGPLMNSILSNALGQPKDKLPELFEAGWKSVTQKHVLFYMFDEKAQEAVEVFNIAGRIQEFDGDYLHINDANLGGRKSNLYVTREVTQEVEIKSDGTVIKTLKITYNNPQAQDGWLNSVLPNWTRVYVPKGSELIDISGFEDKGEVYEDLGKTVFSGGFELRPKGIKKITIVYKLPFKVSDEYKLLIQKQPGLDSPLYTITVGRQIEEFFLRTDKEFKFAI